jgi:hypothetical protein
LQGIHETFLVVSAKLLSLLRIFSGHLCVGIPRDAVLTQMGRKAVPRPAHGAALVSKKARLRVAFMSPGKQTLAPPGASRQVMKRNGRYSPFVIHDSPTLAQILPE